MTNTIHAYAVTQPGGALEPYTYDAGELGEEQVEIAVSYCGICQSDVSMIDNLWGMTTYPLVPGHEVVGTVVAAGDQVKNVTAGQTVGLGWTSGSCLHCRQCLSGNQNLCPEAEATIIGRPGGFADKVRCHWAWAVPLPEGVDAAKAGPLFCGGVTVFNPLVQFGVKPTDRVGVIGIGGLGHLALQFFNKWGCEVTAFTSNEAKDEEARTLGAHHVVSTRDDGQLKEIAGSLDFILSTVNVSLPWDDYFAALAPKGCLHTVGVTPEPIPAPSFTLIGGQKSVSGTPNGSPTVSAEMLDFCARHAIAPITETFPMSEVNAALDHLREGKARYRIVLTNEG